MSKQQNSEPFTNIRYNVRIELDISVAEFCFCDMVYHLSGDKSRTQGWSNASNSYYAKMIGMSNRGIQKLKNRMIEKQLIRRNEHNDDLITYTQRWYKASIQGIVTPIVTEEKPKDEDTPNPEAEPEVTNKQSSHPANSVHTPRTKFAPPVNKVRTTHELSSHNKYRDSESYKLINNEKIDLFLIQKTLAETAHERIDTVASRKYIWHIAEKWMHTQDFEDTWNFLTDGQKEVSTGLVKEWIVKADWQIVNSFKFNKIKSWIQNAGNRAKYPAKNNRGKSAARKSGSAFTYSTFNEES